MSTSTPSLASHPPIVLREGRGIGTGFPTFLAAEVGINHNGDLELAVRTIEAAARAGADGVKFQNYRTEDFLCDESLTWSYVSGGIQVCESQYAMFKRCELSADQLQQLARVCRQNGVVFFSTPTSISTLGEAVLAGAQLLKNGSDLLTHSPLIAAMASTGLPTVLSTGMATREDVEEAVAAYRSAGGDPLILLHCTSAYPTPAGETNLRRMQCLAGEFGCLVGFSDHTEGTLSAVASVAMGACFVEKHFTLDRTLPGPDQRFSSDPEEFAELARAVREVEIRMGSGALEPASVEAEGRQEYRLSCVAAMALTAGTPLEETMVTFSRPGTGIPPSRLGGLLGRSLRQAVPAGHRFRSVDFER